MTSITYSQHADDEIADRKLQRLWVERIARRPDWVEPDPNDPSLERRFARVAELGGRCMRVVVRETSTGIHVITCFPDRGALKRHAHQHL